MIMLYGMTNLKPRDWGGNQTPAALAHHVDPTFNDSLSVRRVILNGGYGYDGWKYFGSGEPVYSVSSPDDTVSFHIRACNRADAKQIVLSYYPGAKVR